MPVLIHVYDFFYNAFLDVNRQYHLHNVSALSTFFEFVSKVAAAATWFPDKKKRL